MDEQSIIEWWEQLPAINLYFFLFVSCFLENVLPPWPGDVFVILIGVTAAKGNGNIIIYFISSVLGNLFGGSFLYYFGYKLISFFIYINRRFNHKFIHRILQPLLDPYRMAKSKRLFQKWGLLIIIISRFLVGIRFSVCIITGAIKFNFIFFITCFMIGVMAWNGLLLWAAWSLGNNWTEITIWLRFYSTVFLISLACAIISYFIFRLIKKKLSYKN